jgi:hypothetical protein
MTWCCLTLLVLIFACILWILLTHIEFTIKLISFVKTHWHQILLLLVGLFSFAFYQKHEDYQVFSKVKPIFSVIKNTDSLTMTVKNEAENIAYFMGIEHEASIIKCMPPKYSALKSKDSLVFKFHRPLFQDSQMFLWWSDQSLNHYRLRLTRKGKYYYVEGVPDALRGEGQNVFSTIFGNVLLIIAGKNWENKDLKKPNFEDLPPRQNQDDQFTKSSCIENKRKVSKPCGL